MNYNRLASVPKPNFIVDNAFSMLLQATKEQSSKSRQLVNVLFACLHAEHPRLSVNVVSCPERWSAATYYQEIVDISGYPADSMIVRVVLRENQIMAQQLARGFLLNTRKELEDQSLPLFTPTSLVQLNSLKRYAEIYEVSGRFGALVVDLIISP